VVICTAGPDTALTAAMSHCPVIDYDVPPVRLFDDFERGDSTPARHSEGSFAFMNRVATPRWHEVRELQEAWYLDYCASAEEAKRADLRRRFQSPNQLQHDGAW
jgi:hypothetical protein